MSAESGTSTQRGITLDSSGLAILIRLSTGHHRLACISNAQRHQPAINGTRRAANSRSQMNDISFHVHLLIIQSEAAEIL